MNELRMLVARRTAAEICADGVAVARWRGAAAGRGRESLATDSRVLRTKTPCDAARRGFRRKIFSAW